MKPVLFLGGGACLTRRVCEVGSVRTRQGRSCSTPVERENVDRGVRDGEMLSKQINANFDG